eukprot:scaffold281874_cov24-Tisochrysis_lutea.AAC.1
MERVQMLYASRFRPLPPEGGPPALPVHALQRSLCPGWLHRQSIIWAEPRQRLGLLCVLAA